MLRVRDGANVRKGRTSTYRLGCVWQFARSTAQAEVRAEVQARLYLKGGWRSLGPQSALPTTLLPDRQSKINSAWWGEQRIGVAGQSEPSPVKGRFEGDVLGGCWVGAGCVVLGGGGLGGQHARWRTDA